MSKIVCGDVMHIHYNIEKIERILHDLHLLTGITFALWDTDYNVICGNITSNPFCELLHQKHDYKYACLISDKNLLSECGKSGKLESHICHAGLYDFAMPLKKNGITAGYLIFGQIKSTLSPNKYSDEDLGPFYRDTPFYSEEKIECLKELIPRIFFEDAITIEYNSFIDSISQYIEHNIQEILSIDFLCRKFNVSKNYLYEVFYTFYGTTVNDYITSVRLDKARKLLKETKEPVYKVAETVGIPNYTYFCRLFKSKNGVSPSKYRNR